jgi:hypothetical protein
MIRGEGLQPLSAPWCSSSVIIEKPLASAWAAMSTNARYRADISVGSRPGWMQLNRAADITMDAERSERPGWRRPVVRSVAGA